MNKLLQAWNEKRKAVIAGLAVLCLFMFSMAVNLPTIFRKIKTDESLSGISELQNKQRELEQMIVEFKQLEKSINEVRSYKDGFWQTSLHGNPATEVKRLLEDAAYKAGLQLNSVGALQRTKIHEQIECFEITINANAQLAEILRFMTELKQKGEFFKWKNITINPDNITRPTYLMLNGTVQVIAPSEQIIKQLAGDKS